MSVKVSFIIPAYNVEQYIAECIESVLIQNIEKEIIIINDGSTDNTLKIIENYESNSDIIKIINTKNNGLSHARNLGIKASSGEYLCFLDSDDYYFFDFASDFYKKCTINNIDIIRGWYSRVYDDGTQEKIIHNVDYLDKPIKSYDFLKESVKQRAFEVVAVTGFFKREFIQENNLLFAEGLSYEDQLYYLEMLLKSRKCIVMQTSRCFYAYRMRYGSITSCHNIKKIYDLVSILNKQIKLIKEMELETQYKAAANNVISKTINHLISIYLRLSQADQQEAIDIIPKKIILRGLMFSTKIRDSIKLSIFLINPRILDSIFSATENKKNIN